METASYREPGDWDRLPSRRVAVNGVELQVTDYGDGPLVLLCHGFPELGFSWRHQVFALAAAGYRVLVPDMRGYGASSRPSDADAYDIGTLAGDLVGLIDWAGASEAILVGHDWGAAVVWHTALAQPDRVRAVAGLSVPPQPRPPVPPVAVLRKRLGEDFYMVWFQQPGVADAVLGADVRRTLLTDDVKVSAWSGGSAAQRPPRPFMTEAELAVFIAAFERTGFTGALNYYRNLDRNWALTEHYAGQRIDRPALFLTGSADLVATFMPADRITELVSDLREHIVIDGGGHWIQQERADEVTQALLRFIRSL